MSQIDALHAIPSYFFKIRFLLLCHLYHGPPSCLFPPVTLSINLCTYVSSSSRTCQRPLPFSSWFYRPNIFWRGAMKLFSMVLSWRLLLHLSETRITPSVPCFWKTWAWLFHEYKRSVFVPIKTEGKTDIFMRCDYYIFLILAHPVYKMSIIQEPNMLEL